MTVGNEDLPVTGSSDVIRVFPKDIQDPDSALVRDAVVAALTSLFEEYQPRADYASLQSDLLTATDLYLAGLTSDHGVEKQPGETDDQLRARALATPDLVTPEAIVAGVLALISPYTAIQPQVCEASLDRWFVSAGTAQWHSFLDASPRYQDRLFPDDAAVNGAAIPNSAPGAARVFNDTIGRYFLLRIPQLNASDDQHAFILPGAGSFFANGSNAGGTESTGVVAAFVYANRLLAREVYDAVVGAVERIKGHSIRWQLIVDSRLT